MQMEVVAADLLTDKVTHRYSQAESERAASIFRDPRIR